MAAPDLPTSDPLRDIALMRGSLNAAIVLHAELGLWPRGGEPLLGVRHILGMQPLIVAGFPSAAVQVGLVE